MVKRRLRSIRRFEEAHEPAARIIGTQWPTFTYVDCCSGPWKLATEDYSNSSFYAAIKELREARDYLHG
jgi:hypothetical protein